MLISVKLKIEGTLAGRQGGDHGNQHTRGMVQNFASCQKDELPIPNGKSSDIAAKAVGMNRETYRQAKAVVKSSPKLANLNKIDTRKELAKAAGAGTDTIDKIKVIEREGTQWKQPRFTGEPQLKFT